MSLVTDAQFDEWERELFAQLDHAPAMQPMMTTLAHELRMARDPGTSWGMITGARHPRSCWVMISGVWYYLAYYSRPPAGSPPYNIRMKVGSVRGPVYRVFNQNTTPEQVMQWIRALRPPPTCVHHPNGHQQVA